MGRARGGDGGADGEAGAVGVLVRWGGGLGVELVKTCASGGSG